MPKLTPSVDDLMVVDRFSWHKTKIRCSIKINKKIKVSIVFDLTKKLESLFPDLLKEESFELKSTIVLITLKCKKI